MSIVWIIGIYILLLPLTSRLAKMKAQGTANRRYQKWEEDLERTGDTELFMRRTTGLSEGFLTAGDLASLKYDNIAFLFIFIMLGDLLPFFSMYLDMHLLVSFVFVWMLHTLSVSHLLQEYIDRE
ncbi:MAG: hypothetical protein Q4A78_04420 [Peptostreptococcaceae bacterium]|nr:hypothetical protein [Peptostreptococcaceae bacterium]